MGVMERMERHGQPTKAWIDEDGETTQITGVLGDMTVEMNQAGL